MRMNFIKAALSGIQLQEAGICLSLSFVHFEMYLFFCNRLTFLHLYFTGMFVSHATAFRHFVIMIIIKILMMLMTLV